MMFCDTRNYGQKNRRCRLIDLKRNALNAVVSKDCSERVKTVVRQHSQSSDVTPGRNYEVIMTNACTKHQAKGA